MHDQLFSLQGKLTVADYALKFHILAATSGWNETALITAYSQRLNSNIHQ